MIKLKKKYKYFFDKKKFTIGDVLKVFYIVFLRTKKKKKKMYVFLGLCINKKKNYFDLVNIVKKEKIFLSFDLKSPVIFKYLIIRLYKKLVFRISRIYFKHNNYYFDDLNNKDNVIISNLNSFKFDFMFSAYIKKTLVKRKKKLRKLRRKYSKTENWRNLKRIRYFYKRALYQDLNDEEDLDFEEEFNNLKNINVE